MAYIGNKIPANFQSLPAVQRFNGDGSDTTFTLAAQIANDQSILVSVDGVTQDSNAYAVSGTTLTFTAAPSSGTGNIFVNTISPVGSTVVPPDGSVTKVKTDFYISQATAPSSPAQGDMWFNTSSSIVSGISSKALAVYNGVAWQKATTGIAMTATGGTKTTSGIYTIHTFTSSGTFATNVAGLVDYLVVAGGGGGGGSFRGGGGGAGGLLTLDNLSINQASYTVTVGAGGSGNSNGTGSDGANSSIAGSGITTVTSIGGGGGGHWQANNGRAGGSGGGGAGGQTGDNSTGGGATANQGFAGGAGANNTSAQCGGGGGGAGAAGVVGGSGGTNGDGGVGLASSFSGSSVFYAGGGGAGAYGGGNNTPQGGSGGGAVGRYGDSPYQNGAAGTANTGGGGGGSSGQVSGAGTGGTGGSGIVIIRYLT